MSGPPPPSPETPRIAIVMVILGMGAISVNDLLIKFLSAGYPLHQMVFIRSVIGLSMSLVFLQLEGGWALLRTGRPFLHLARGLLIVLSNMLFFAALAVMPLADATALFFVAPLCITLLSILFLGERVGPHRIGAILLGLLGVIVMTRPGTGWEGNDFSRWALALPIVAAVAYSGMQVLTRKLGVYSRASALASYIQAAFLIVSLVFYVVAGDGRYAEGLENDSLIFLLRPWIWPPVQDWPLFGLLGAASAAIGYALAQAYRLGNAATVSSFEYTAMPMAIFWGWLIFGELPDAWGVAGIVLISGAGIYVFARERRRRSPVAPRRPVRRV